jgi:single-stranded DNA-binding protein
VSRGNFDAKAFGDQVAACAEYLSAGREVGIEGRLRFEEFATKGGDYALASTSSPTRSCSSRALAATARRRTAATPTGKSPRSAAERRPRASSCSARGQSGRGPRRGRRRRRARHDQPEPLDPIDRAGSFAYLESDVPVAMMLEQWGTQLQGTGARIVARGLTWSGG